VAPAALAAASTLGSGTRAIAVYAQRWSERASGPLWVYLHRLADPGNVGTVLRAAHAFGASGVALGPGCADPYSPKAVRASMGAIFAVALVRAPDVAALPGERIALVAHAGEPLSDLRCAAGGARQSRAGEEGGSVPDGTRAGSPEVSRGARRPLTLLVGAEREGLPEEVVTACEHIAHIPIAGDSLNAAMAATIALYELAGSEERGARLGDLRPPAPPGSGERGARLGDLRSPAPPSRVPT
jgi:TrmH family RNA methyltransferase